MWVSYSQNYLYIASFVLFVGVVFPLVTLGLWAFWECCHETDQEDEDEDNDRHRTLVSQLVTWSLGVAIFTLILLVCVFLIILLSGNSLLSSGVREGGGEVGVVLQELADVRDDALNEVEHLLDVEYHQLRQRITGSILSEVGPAVADGVRNETQNDVNSFYEEVYSLLQLASTLHNYTQSILSHISHPSLEALLHSLNANLSELVTVCAVLEGSADLVNSSLFTICDGVTVLSDRRPPPPELVELEELLYVDSSVQVEVFDSYLTSVLIPYLNTSSQLGTDTYIGPSSSFGHALSSFLGKIFHYYNTTLTFDLPTSQLQLEEYLGSRYLDNWEVARYACTLTFALVVLLLGTCLLVPIGRGLLNILAIYNGGDELTNSEGAHQAGTTLKKVAFTFVGVCVVSSASFGLFLCVNGVLGRACGPNGNFSGLLDNVIDHSGSWGGSYPLGWALLGNQSYPLTIGGILKRCRDNQSLYESMHLETRLDLSELSFLSRDNLSDDMRSLANSIDSFHPLTPSLTTLLLHLHNATTIPVLWTELQMLTEDLLFVDNTVGFSQLQLLVNTSALSDLPGFDVDGITNETFSAILSSTEHALFEVSSYIDEVLRSAINTSAVLLREGLTAVNVSKVIRDGQSLSESVDGMSIIFSRKELSLASKTVADMVEDYSSLIQLTLRCSTGSCVSLAAHTDLFSTAVCQKVVPGMDVFWSTLLVIFSLSLLVPPLCLVLAARFIDPELKETLSTKFHFWGSVLRQLRAISWLLLSLGVCLWFIITVSSDQFFRDKFCEDARPGCCVECLWSVGVVFLLLASGVGIISQIYQCWNIYRITKCAHWKVKRYWVDRNKAIQFYTQLFILLLQDVPFLLLAGLYAAPPNMLTVPALFTIAATLTGIMAYIVYLILERGNILTYFAWLKKSLTVDACRQSPRGDLTVTGEGTSNGHANGAIPMTTRVRGAGRYGSSESEPSDSEGPTQPDGDLQFTTATTGNHQLSNIPEHPNGRPNGVSVSSPHPPTSPGAVGGRSLPPPTVSAREETESCSELSQAQPASTVLLDHLYPSNESAAVLRREAAVRQPMVGGVEVAPLEFPTPTNSDFGSNYSVMSDYPGYYSSQQHDEDYRDDYSDSDYSQLPSQRSRLTLHLSGAVGGVSMDV